MIPYLQCELLARDLDSRLLIASYLLKAGTPVVIGQVWGILANLGRCPRGVNLFATANMYQARGMKMCADAGHLVLAVDEETISLRSQTAARVHADATSHMRRFFCQDEAQRQLLAAAFPDLDTVVTGNARIELLRQHRHIYHAEARECRRKGPYLLINTNFSIVNSAWGSVENALAIARPALNTETESLEEDIRRQQANMATITQVLESIPERLPRHRIVLRPHPTENVAYWQRFPAVEIVTGSNAIPWMLSADLVIHTNSTTGYEAALMDVPCLNVGVPDDYYIMDLVNCTIPDRERASAAIVSFLTEHGGPIHYHRPQIGAAPADGARKIADQIRVLLKGPVTRITSWGVAPRTDVQQKKFSISVNDFVARATAICGSAVKDITPLDDSLFQLAPLAHS